MLRLNSEIRQQIIENAIKAAGIPARQEALRVRRAAWAEAVRLDALGGPDEAKALDKLQAKIKTLLEPISTGLIKNSRDALRTDYDMRVNVGGCRAIANFNGTPVRDGKVPFVHKITKYEHTIVGDHPLALEFHTIENEAATLESDRETIAENVRAAVSKVTTIEKLLKMWPEAKELIPTNVQTKAQLPAIRREELNSLIGLPSDQ